MFESDLFDDIACIAYELWERGGCIHGRDVEYWCEAEHIVITRIQPIEEEKPKKAGSTRKKTVKSAAKPTKAAAKTRKPSASQKKG